MTDHYLQPVSYPDLQCSDQSAFECPWNAFAVTLNIFWKQYLTVTFLSFLTLSLGACNLRNLSFHDVQPGIHLLEFL